MEMMAVWAAVLIVYGVFPGIAAQPEGAAANTVFPLDLAENSVDDMYSGCTAEMSSKITEYLMNEKNANSKFRQAWEEAEKYYDNNRRGFMQLQKELFLAVYIYTSGPENIHEDFNAAVRSQGPQYKTTFGYHALHYYLTVALQTLKTLSRKKCFTVYRRSNRYYRQDVVNQEVRFGDFASASVIGYINPERFGEKSCFEIFTCSGPDVSLLSKFGDAEGEVLIPPYEVFKVRSVQTRSKNKILPCDVVYKLKHTRVLSYLNCALFKS